MSNAIWILLVLAACIATPAKGVELDHELDASPIVEAAMPVSTSHGVVVALGVSVGGVMLMLLGTDLYKSAKEKIADWWAEPAISLDKRPGTFVGESSTLNRLVIVRSRKSPIKLHLEGEDYELYPLHAKADAREVVFDAKCKDEDWSVAKAKWEPNWAGQPNHILLVFEFEKGGRRITEVFKRQRSKFSR